MMDAQARKAFFRAKLKEKQRENREKRIDSPLVRYNESNQPVCRVCDVVLKSESSWVAHEASRKHHEAIKNVKAVAAGGACISGGKLDSPKDTIDKPRLTSSLPIDFFDNHDQKKPKIGPSAVDKSYSVTNPAPVKHVDSGTSASIENKRSHAGSHTSKLSDSVKKSDESATKTESEPFSQVDQPSLAHIPEVKQVKGVLPAGFFDNKDADLRARGIEPVKVDIKDEYKEFEKAIQEDLQEVDERLEEEEIDAAEMIEEAESLEQKTYRERVEMLKKMQMELKVAKFARSEKQSLAFKGEDSSGDSSGEDEDDDENFAVDWRAQHL